MAHLSLWLWAAFSSAQTWASQREKIHQYNPCKSPSKTPSTWTGSVTSCCPFTVGIMRILKVMPGNIKVISPSHCPFVLRKTLRFFWTMLIYVLLSFELLAESPMRPLLTHHPVFSDWRRRKVVVLQRQLSNVVYVGSNYQLNIFGIVSAAVLLDACLEKDNAREQIPQVFLQRDAKGNTNTFGYCVAFFSLIRFSNPPN
jgi:hypothetical protein